jgi:hypothetical protein
MAAHNGHTAAVQALLEARADVNQLTVRERLALLLEGC